MALSVCKGRRKRRQCQRHEQKWSYAIPLELIYLTPLNKWNPHKLKYKGTFNSAEGKTVNANGRNGGLTKDKAFDGVNSKTYYLTPNEFFSGTETHTDAADTTRKSVGVLDPEGNVQKVRASGIRIFLPNIQGVGILRQRYPIMPVHGEGSTTWKELEAVQDFLMESKTHARLFREKLATQGSGDGGTNGGGSNGGERNTDTRLATGRSTKSGIIPHVHEITLTQKEVELLKKGQRVNKTTSTTQGHQHDIAVAWFPKNKRFYMAFCASTPDKNKPFMKKCRDMHRAVMRILPDQ